MPSRAAEINLARDLASEKSVYRFYREVLRLRASSDAVKDGAFRDLTRTPGSFVYSRTLGDEEIIVAVAFEKPVSGILPATLTADAYRPVLMNLPTETPFSDAFSPFEVRVYRKNAAQ